MTAKLGGIRKTTANEYYLLLGKQLDFRLENVILYRVISTKDNFHSKIPFIDRCTFYSLFVEGIHIFSIKLKAQKGSIMLEDIMEIISPISWVTSAQCYFQTI